MQRALIVIFACALVAWAGARVHDARSEQSGPAGISSAERAATLDLDGVAPQDRSWILQSVAAARPEAQRLIAEIDGLVDVRTDLHAAGSPYQAVPAQAIGLTDFSGDRATIALDSGLLDGDRAIDRPMVVLHELGHVIDYLLVDDATVRQLDATIPPSDQCTVPLADFGGCGATEERFADTFAKWALRGRFSLAGSGYGIPTPPSLEDWGAPLARLAIRLDTQSR